jgi:hypothetical protein
LLATGEPKTISVRTPPETTKGTYCRQDDGEDDAVADAASVVAWATASANQLVLDVNISMVESSTGSILILGVARDRGPN